MVFRNYNKNNGQYMRREQIKRVLVTLKGESSSLFDKDKFFMRSPFEQELAMNYHDSFLKLFIPAAAAAAAAAKLEKLNKRALRSIFNDNTSTYTTLLETANMPTLHDRRVQDMSSILIYKVIHGTTPTPLRTLLTLITKSPNLLGELILVQPRVTLPSME